MSADKTVIITGANSGLGFQCAKTIAEANKGWHIVMACRNIFKAEQAKQEIISLTRYSSISVLELDISYMRSVRNFVDVYSNSGFPPLKGLINNAGIQVLSALEYTKDGFEATFGTNHLGHFLLTNLLLDQFSEPARIVVVSSGTHNPNTIDGRFNKPLFLGAKQLAEPESEKEMTGMQRYTTSKLANVLFSYELARRLQDRKITVNAFDPAAVPQTNLLSSIKSPLLRKALPIILPVFNLMGMKSSTPEKSGAAMARLLLDPSIEGITGSYFQIDKEIKSSVFSYDLPTAKALWEDSLQLVELKNKKA